MRNPDALHGMRHSLVPQTIRAIRTGEKKTNGDELGPAHLIVELKSQPEMGSIDHWLTIGFPQMAVGEREAAWAAAAVLVQKANQAARKANSGQRRLKVRH